MKFSSKTAACLLVFPTLSNGFSVNSLAASPLVRRTSELFMASDESIPDEKRVVVTGLGVVSGCGIGQEDFFEACLEGKSSLGRVQRFDPSAYTCQIGSEVPDSMFDPKDFFVNSKNIRSNDRYTHFAVAAARLALKDADMGDVPETLPDPDMIGVMVGTAFGGLETIEKEHTKLQKKPERPKVSQLSKKYEIGLNFHSVKLSFI